MEEGWVKGKGRVGNEGRRGRKGMEGKGNEEGRRDGYMKEKKRGKDESEGGMRKDE